MLFSPKKKKIKDNDEDNAALVLGAARLGMFKESISKN